MGRHAALLLLCVFSTAAIAADVACGSGGSERSLVGPAPLTAKLRAAAAQRTGVFFEQGQFDEESFRYLGEVRGPSGKRWHVVLLDTTWGLACRSTKRLLVYSADLKYLGQYGGFSVELFRLEGDTIHVDGAEPAEGNQIRFSDRGPPAKAHVDGEVLTFNQ